jgi:hypothetical protein
VFNKDRLSWLYVAHELPGGAPVVEDRTSSGAISPWGYATAHRSSATQNSPASSAWESLFIFITFLTIGGLLATFATHCRFREFARWYRVSIVVVWGVISTTDATFVFEVVRSWKSRWADEPGTRRQWLCSLIGFHWQYLLCRKSRIGRWNRVHVWMRCQISLWFDPLWLDR